MSCIFSHTRHAQDSHKTYTAHAATFDREEEDQGGERRRKRRRRRTKGPVYRAL